MNTEHIFEIADWKVRIQFDHEDKEIGMHLLPSFETFRNDASTLDELLCLTVDGTMKRVLDEDCLFVKDCIVPNGTIHVSQMTDGAYQFIIYDLQGRECCMMQSNGMCNEFHVKICEEHKWRIGFGLNNAIMMAFAFAGACHQTLLIHASLVRHEGWGYAFVAKSGTGKSTQTQNWIKMIPGTDLMNDDNPVVRIVDGKAMIYGSPWSGKTPCYRQIKAPLAAVTLIARDKKNWVEKVHPVIALKNLLEASSAMKWDKNTYQGVRNTASAVVGEVGNYTLHCTADPDSALVCYETIAKK